MSTEGPTLEHMNHVLDIIHEIAGKISSIDGIPAKVDDGLDQIIALARYKMNVINYKSDNSQ